MKINVNSLKRKEINATFSGHPAGEVSEEELLALSGGQEVNPQSLTTVTRSSSACVALSLAFCPTSACTSDCTNIGKIC
ncbi:hypothetical protein ANABIO32_43510 [Rossellomorea marisflavi]|uniref:class II lanthipeptide, LchA2/BrtA2 family n=1 Tax=Rossellomorea marisflavi TaxID=189381 RepID=UPI0025C8E4D1|nr:class II lanthipeptide, LchA2/BrtA2 family [Rossellomorea marisflavi]GLI86536.1 hypothetical protein ANABIO32_43510 [Rossellomorea marisflavi]